VCDTDASMCVCVCSLTDYIPVFLRTCGNPTWPDNGEIDIIEYVNTDKVDATTLHTNGGCDQAGEDPNSFTGQYAYITLLFVVSLMHSLQ
jgi:hypothetical protein